MASNQRGQQTVKVFNCSILEVFSWATITLKLNKVLLKGMGHTAVGGERICKDVKAWPDKHCSNSFINNQFNLLNQAGEKTLGKETEKLSFSFSLIYYLLFIYCVLSVWLCHLHVSPVGVCKSGYSQDCQKGYTIALLLLSLCYCIARSYSKTEGKIVLRTSIVYVFVGKLWPC